MQQPRPLHMENTTAGPPAGTLLATLKDLPSHGGKDIIFRLGDQQINVFVQKTGDDIHVYENRCPHAGTPLNMFGDKFLSLDGAYIICRTHGALFTKETGKCTSGPCKGQYLQPVAFEVRSGAVYSA